MKHSQVIFKRTWLRYAGMNSAIGAHVVANPLVVGWRHPIWCQEQSDIRQTVQLIGSCGKVMGGGILVCSSATSEQAAQEVR